MENPQLKLSISHQPNYQQLRRLEEMTFQKIHRFTTKHTRKRNQNDKEKWNLMAIFTVEMFVKIIDAIVFNQANLISLIEMACTHSCQIRKEMKQFLCQHNIIYHNISDKVDNTYFPTLLTGYYVNYVHHINHKRSLQIICHFLVIIMKLCFTAKTKTNYNIVK